MPPLSIGTMLIKVSAHAPSFYVLRVLSLSFAEGWKMADWSCVRAGDGRGDMGRILGEAPGRRNSWRLMEGETACAGNTLNVNGRVNSGASPKFPDLRLRVVAPEPAEVHRGAAMYD